MAIHVGQTKAGSTSIQNYLNIEYFRLLRKIFLFIYPTLRCDDRFDINQTAGHLELLRNIRKNRTEAFDTELAAFPDTTLALSTESIVFDQTDNALKQFTTYFDSYKIDVVVIVQSQFDWVRARYTENVLGGFHGQINLFRRFIDKC